eukprot:XP_011446815.1 PREDICTED: probable ATP-dependent RNA helicase DDX58 isoform X2 [Crassostrea gigas]
MEQPPSISLYERTEDDTSALGDGIAKLSLDQIDDHPTEVSLFDEEEEEEKVSESKTSKYAYSENANLAEENDLLKKQKKKHVEPKKFELRPYQQELAERALRGDNCVIIAPTGSGKTHVAIRIIQHHLEKLERGKKIVFIVDKNNLANQQSERIEEYLKCRLKVISGDIQREVECVQDWDSLLPHYDVFVSTAQMLLNAINDPEQNVCLESFCLFIFDECHHCGRKHPFQRIVDKYVDTRLDRNGDKSRLPQVVGFTASLGVGKVNALGNAVEHLKTFLAIMDADCLVTVQRNKQDLATHVNNPKQYIVSVPGRRIDDFGTRIKILMSRTEDYLVYTGVGTVDRIAIRPPSIKGDIQYTSWLEGTLRKAQAKLQDPDMARTLFTIRQLLEIYNNALIHYTHARAIDALNFIKDEVEKFPNISKYTEIERKVKSVLEDEYMTLEASALDHGRTSENPLLEKLKEIIISTYAEEPNMRAIVFVRTRIMTECLVNWMEDTEELQHIKAQKYTGAKASISEGGMERHEQVSALELFRDGEYKVIMATTVAEEGLDIKECNLVVRYDYAGSPVAMMQARGRGRAKNSRFYILASADKCVAEKEQANVTIEPLMEAAMKQLQRLIELDSYTFQVQKQGCQRQMKRERELETYQQQSKVTVPNYSIYNLSCLKCNAFLCTSNDIRKILNHHYGCIRQDLKYRVVCTRFDQPKYPGEDIEMGVGQVDCSGRGCGVKLGTIALYEGIYFPILNIKALKIAKGTMKGDTLKKWGMVEKYFTVQDMTEYDMEYLSKSDRLIEWAN